MRAWGVEEEEEEASMADEAKRGGEGGGGGVIKAGKMMRFIRSLRGCVEVAVLRA